MEFNVNKYGVMHIENRNSEFYCQMNNGQVKSVDEGRDPGVLISRDLKFLKQCLLSSNKGNLILYVINREVSYKSAEVISKVYKSYVRLQLEYCLGPQIFF